jgi:uncharacterized secreted protein with C-terminal beta-propeller domain
MKSSKVIIFIIIFSVFLNNFCDESGDKKKELPEILKVNLDFKSSLKRFQSCTDLEKTFKAELIRRLKRQAQQEYYYLTTPIIGWGGTEVDMAGAANESYGSSDDGGTEHSTTNTQEEGVDEGDLVKTDGEYIYAVRGEYFFIIDANPADTSNVVGQIKFNEYLYEIYLYNDYIIALSNSWELYNYEKDLTRTKVYFIDISQKNNPVVISEYSLTGYFMGSRRKGNKLSIVHQISYYLPDQVYAWDLLNDFSYYFATGSEFDTVIIEAILKALSANIAKVENLQLDDFLPASTKLTYDSEGLNPSESDLELNCNNFYFPENGNGDDIGQVTTIHLDTSDLPSQTIGLMSNWDGMYMSSDNLYLTSTNRWLWFDPVEVINMDNPEPMTAIHKFVADENQYPEYEASGIVDGFVNNSFSLSEYQGYLRIGTTRGGWWGEDISNKLTVLERADSELKIVGEIDNIAPAERIYSMRYDRERGYMVTFEQIDPLFTFDLSDPENPQLMGEIEVTGFSTYIHLFGENNSKLLTIGRSEGWGNKLQIFDVSDLTNPQLVDDEELGEGWSDALYDHHAFLYYAPLKILAIPYSSWDNTIFEFSTGLKLFEVTETALTFIDDITHPPISIDYYDYYYPTVDRAVIIGENIFSFSYHTVEVTNSTNLQNINSIDFPNIDTYYWY